MQAPVPVRVCVPFIFIFTCSWLANRSPFVRFKTKHRHIHARTHTDACARRLCMLHPIHVDCAAELAISIDIVLFLFRFVSAFFFSPFVCRPIFSLSFSSLGVTTICIAHSHFAPQTINQMPNESFVCTECGAYMCSTIYLLFETR